MNNSQKVRVLTFEEGITLTTVEHLIEKGEDFLHELDEKGKIETETQLFVLIPDARYELVIRKDASVKWCEVYDHHTDEHFIRFVDHTYAHKDDELSIIAHCRGILLSITEGLKQ